MSKSILLRQRVRLAIAARDFRARTEGVAAIEFALIVPILASLFIGAVEMSQAVTANRRVTQVASSTGDLVARVDTNIKDTDVLDIMKIGSYLLSPLATTTLKVDIRVVGSSPTDATNTKLIWICSYDASNAGSVNCTCPSTKPGYAIPTGLVSTNDYVVISDVNYGYKPTLFDYYMKKSYGGSGGVYAMKETVYLKPRSLAPQLVIGAGPTCPLT